MAFKGITVNTAPEESAHIYAQDDAAIYQSIFGGDGVLNTGNKFKATVLSNNSIRVSDGLMCIGGHIGRTEYGSYNDLTIQNGAAGYNRNDIIYARFITNGNIDTYALAVKKGTAAAGVAVDPVMIQGNLYEGEASREYPLWRVRLEGLSITKVEQMFRIIPTIPDLEAQYDALNEGLGGKTIAEAIRDLNTDLWQKIYPIGAIYMSVSAASPATLFGGTWERITDRFLLAAGSTYAAGTTGGEASVTLSENQMPKHYHRFPNNALVVTTLNNAAVSQPATASGYKRGDGVSGNTDYAGGGQAHNNMPPYLAVYVWKRVA